MCLYKCVHLCVCVFVCVRPCTVHASTRVCAHCWLRPLCAMHENTSHTTQGLSHGKINMLVVEIRWNVLLERD